MSTHSSLKDAFSSYADHLNALVIFPPPFSPFFTFIFAYFTLARITSLTILDEYSDFMGFQVFKMVNILIYNMKFNYTQQTINSRTGLEKKKVWTQNRYKIVCSSSEACFVVGCLQCVDICSPKRSKFLTCISCKVPLHNGVFSFACIYLTTKDAFICTD